MNKLGIVVIGYKNIEGTKRLLNSLSNVDYCNDSNITLIISIDYSGDDSVEKIASSFEWKHGDKFVVAHKVNLGLRKHILSCGNYMNTYGLSAIAVLEDDVYVSPEMYKYMRGAIDFYKDNPKIAGISLYKHEYNINAMHPFNDYCDYGDTFFIQYAMSWGQIWFKDKWESFVDWYNNEKWKLMDQDRIPANILKWKNSWLKFHIMYCIDQGLYFVYPRVSLTTNFSDVGAHNKSFSTSMQVRMCINKGTSWNFTPFNRTLAVYDSFFENENLSNFLNLENLEVDLYGVKKYLPSTRYVVTKNIMPYKIINSWGLRLRPMEANIFNHIPGNEIYLYDLSIKTKNKIKKNNDRYFEYDLKGVNIISLENIRYCYRFAIRYLKLKLGKRK